MTSKAEAQSNITYLSQTPNLELLNQSYETQLSNTLVQRADSLRNKRVGSCVNAVREFLGEEQTARIAGYGYARNIPTNSSIPEVGAIIKTRESPQGHLGVVISIERDSLEIYEGNGYAGYNLAGTRWIKINDKNIVGYLILKEGDL